MAYTRPRAGSRVQAPNAGPFIHGPAAVSRRPRQTQSVNQFSGEDNQTSPSFVEYDMTNTQPGAGSTVLPTSIADSVSGGTGLYTATGTFHKSLTAGNAPQFGGVSVLQNQLNVVATQYYYSGLNNIVYPFVVIEDSSGNLWLSNDAIQGVQVLSTTAGSFFGTTARANQFTSVASSYGITPNGMTFDASGNLYMVTASESSVYVLSSTSTTLFGVSVPANTLTSLSTCFSGISSFGPEQLVFDTAGNLYISNYSGNNIVVLPKTTGTLFGQSVTANTGVALIATSSSSVAYLTIDSTGNLYYGGGSAYAIYVLPVSSGTLYGVAVTAHTQTSLVTTVEPVEGLCWANGNIWYNYNTSSAYTIVVPGVSGTIFGTSVTANTPTTIFDEPAADVGTGVYVDSSGNLFVLGYGNPGGVSVCPAPGPEPMLSGGPSVQKKPGVTLTAGGSSHLVAGNSIDYPYQTAVWGGSAPSALLAAIVNPSGSVVTVVQDGDGGTYASSGNPLTVLPSNATVATGHAVILAVASFNIATSSISSSIGTFTELNSVSIVAGSDYFLSFWVCTNITGAAKVITANTGGANYGCWAMELSGVSSFTAGGSATIAVHNAIEITVPTTASGQEAIVFLGGGSNITGPSGWTTYNAGYFTGALDVAWTQASTNPIYPFTKRGGKHLTGGTNRVLYGVGCTSNLANVLHSGLSSPESVAVDSAGNLWIGNEGNNTVQVIPIASGTLFGQSVTKNTLKTIATLSEPVTGLAFDANGNLFIATLGAPPLYVLPIASGSLFGDSVTANSVTAIQSGNWPTSPDNTNFTQIAFDGSGNFYGANQNGNANIIVLPKSTGTVFGQSVTANTPVALTAATSGDGQMYSVAFDTVGNLYFGTLQTICVLPFASGTIFGHSVTANTQTTLYSGGGNIFTKGLTFDTAGNLYMCNYSSDLDVLPHATGTLFGVSVTANTLAEIVALSGSSVAYTAIDASGNIYLADYELDEIWVVPTASDVYTGNNFSSGGVKKVLKSFTATGPLPNQITKLTQTNSFNYWARNGSIMLPGVVGKTLGTPGFNQWASDGVIEYPIAIPPSVTEENFGVAPALTKKTNRILSAIQSFIGAISGSVSGGGGGGTTQYQSLSAGLSMSGAVTKNILYNLAATQSLAGALHRLTGYNLTATLSRSGALVKKTLRTLTAGLSFPTGIVKVGTASATSASASSASINYTATSGNLLFVVACADVNGYLSVSDGVNSYAPVSTSSYDYQVWYAKNITGGPLTIVCSGGTAAWAAQVIEFTGANATNPILSAVTSASGNSSGATSAGTSLFDYVVGFTAIGSPSALGTPTITSPSFSSALTTQYNEAVPAINGGAAVGISHGPIAGLNTETFSSTAANDTVARRWCVIIAPSNTGALTKKTLYNFTATLSRSGSLVKNILRSLTARLQLTGISYDAKMATLSPTGWWKLADAVGSTVAIDSSGNGNTGTVENGITYGQPGPFTADPVDTSAYFNGVETNGNFIQTSLLSSATTNITVIAWCNMPSGGSAEGVFFKQGVIGGSPNGYALGVGGTSITFPGYNSGNQLIASFDGVRQVQSSATLSTGWHMCALVLDGSGHPHIYLDGVQVYTDTGTNAIAPTAIVYIGTDYGHNYWQGDMAQVAFFTSALTAAQIGSLYEASQGVVTKKTMRTFNGNQVLSGMLNKLSSYQLNAALQPTGSLLKGTNRALSAGLGSHGALTKKPLIALPGATQSLSGALQRQAGKHLAGTQATSGSITRKTNKHLSGTLALAGTQFSVGLRIFFTAGLNIAGNLAKKAEVSFSGNQTMSGRLIRQARINLSGNLSMSGLLNTLETQTFFKTLTAGLSLVGSLTKQTRVSYAASTTPSGVLKKQTRVVLDAIASMSGVLAKQSEHHLSGNLTNSGHLAKEPQITLGGTQNLEGTVSRHTEKFLGASMQLSGQLNRLTRRVLNAGLNFIGTLIRYKPVKPSIIVDVFRQVISTDVTQSATARIDTLAPKTMLSVNPMVTSRIDVTKQNASIDVLNTPIEANVSAQK